MHETVCFEWAQHAYVHRFIFSWIKHEFIAIDCVKLHFSSFLSNLNTGFRNSHFFTPWRWSKTRFQKDKKWNETPHLHIFSEHIQSTYFFFLTFLWNTGLVLYNLWHPSSQFLSASARLDVVCLSVNCEFQVPALLFFQASTYFKAKQLRPVTDYLQKIFLVWHSKKEWQMCLVILNPFTLYIWDTFQYSLINSLSLVSLHPMAHTHENTSISFTLLLFKSVLNIASKPNYISSSSPPCSWCSPLHQALSATAGQIHTRRQHLQLSRGLARCHQDEPVQRQLPQLRLYLPAAGGTNDLRVSSTACVQMTGFQTHIAFDGHTFIKRLSVKCMYF